MQLKDIQRSSHRSQRAVEIDPKSADVGCFLVSEHKTILGILTDEDLRRALNNQGLVI